LFLEDGRFARTRPRGRRPPPTPKPARPTSRRRSPPQRTSSSATLKADGPADRARLLTDRRLPPATTSRGSTPSPPRRRPIRAYSPPRPAPTTHPKAGRPRDTARKGSGDRGTGTAQRRTPPSHRTLEGQFLACGGRSADWEAQTQHLSNLPHRRPLSW